MGLTVQYASGFGLRVAGDLLGLLHGVPEVTMERVVVQAITFGGTPVACAPQPLLWVPVRMPRMGVPATTLRIVYAAHAAGRLTNGLASSQAGGQEAMRLGVGAAALSSEASELASASGVPYHEAAHSVGLGDTAAVLSSKTLAEMRALMGGAGIACKTGCGRLFDCGCEGEKRRRAHEYGEGSTAPCKGRAGPPNRLQRGQHTGELLCCDKCGFYGKLGSEWTQWCRKESHEATCPGRVVGSWDVQPWLESPASTAAPTAGAGIKVAAPAPAPSAPEAVPSEDDVIMVESEEEEGKGNGGKAGGGTARPRPCKRAKVAAGRAPGPVPPDPFLPAVTVGKPLHQPAALAPQRPGSASFVLKWVPPSELGKGKKKGGKGNK
jgi:hypothetical protein